MQNILTIVEIVASALLIGAILLQQQGAGLGATFGGEGNTFRTKRGLEKSLHYATIVLSAVFLGAALALIIVS